VQESLKIVDYVYFVSEGVIVAEARQPRFGFRGCPTCTSSCMARPTARCRSIIRRRPMPTTCDWEGRVLKQSMKTWGIARSRACWRIGFAARFFVVMLLHSGRLSAASG